MAPIVTSVIVPGPIDAVWRALAAVETHAEWMTDAESIEFLSEARSGIGTVIRVRTRVGPLRVDDVMEFDRWEPPRLMTVRHVGRVAGEGRFELVPEAGHTRLTWTERLVFPWYLGGKPGLAVAAPILRRIFAANLRRFATWVG